MSQQEQWKPIENYEQYRVTDWGRVCSLYTHRFPKSRPNRGDGYLQVVLVANGVKKHCYIHHLVAAAFLGPRPDNHQVNHRNGIKADNRDLNLEYCTPKQNQQHAVATGLIRGGEFNGSAKLTRIAVAEMRAKHASGVKCKDLGKQYGVHVATIRYVVRGDTWPERRLAS